MACSAAPMQIASLSGLVSSIAASHSVCQLKFRSGMAALPLLKASDAALNFECCFVVSDGQFDGVNLLLQISSVFGVSLLPPLIQNVEQCAYLTQPLSNRLRRLCAESLTLELW